MSESQPWLRYASLIERLQQEAVAQPARYRVKLVLVSLLGYGVIFLLLALGLALGVGIVALAVVSKNPWIVKAGVKFLWIPVVMGLLTLKALFVRIPRPGGIVVESGAASALFELIERTRRAANAPRLHGVHLSEDFNAYVVNAPLFGFFGWNRRYLVLGVQLLASVDAERLRAILAHEFGHLSRKHSRFSNWIYRTRNVWGQFVEAMESRTGAGERLLKAFLSWYAPYFNAYSFVLARQDEYEADRVAATATGASTAAAALVTVHAHDDAMASGFWRDTWQRMAGEANPPEDIYECFMASGEALTSDEREAYVTRALESTTGLEDTHPCLSDRLAALEVGPTAYHVPASDATALQLLGDGAVGALSEIWRDFATESWQATHQELVAHGVRRDELLAKDAEPGLDASEWVELAEIEGAFQRDQQPALERALELCPNHANASFMLGQLLLPVDGQRAETLLESAAAASPELKPPVAAMLIGRYHERGDDENAERCAGVLYEAERLEAAAIEERQNIDKKDVFLAHDLDEGQRRAFEQTLLLHKNLRRAWLFRKQVEHFPDNPAYILLIELGGLYSSAEDKVNEIAQSLGETPILIVQRSDYRWLHRRIKKSKLAFEYRRKAALRAATQAAATLAEA